MGSQILPVFKQRLFKDDPKGDLSLATDTGISKTVLNLIDWAKIKEGCKVVKTSKRFRPYGTQYHLSIKGKALVELAAENGVTIDTWVYVNNHPKEQSILGKRNIRKIGVVKLNIKGEKEAVELDDEEGIRKRDCKGRVRVMDLLKVLMFKMLYTCIADGKNPNDESHNSVPWHSSYHNKRFSSRVPFL